MRGRKREERTGRWYLKDQAVRGPRVSVCYLLSVLTEKVTSWFCFRLLLLFSLTL